MVFLHLFLNSYTWISNKQQKCLNIHTAQHYMGHLAKIHSFLSDIQITWAYFYCPQLCDLQVKISTWKLLSLCAFLQQCNPHQLNSPPKCLFIISHWVIIFQYQLPAGNLDLDHLRSAFSVPPVSFLRAAPSILLIPIFLLYNTAFQEIN